MSLEQVKQNHPCKMLQDLFFMLLIFVVYLNHLALSYHVPLVDVDPKIATASSNRSEIEHHAVYHSRTIPETGYSGAMATVDVYSFPNLKNGEVTAAVIWVSDDTKGDDLSQLNDIQAGWAVYPSAFGDSKTHFFVYWMIDGYNSTGCYNLDCEGFVPVNDAPITPGDTLEPANGQTKISFKIFKNKDDGDWWLHFGYDINNLSPVGFWPKSLFTHLMDNAQYIGWGGFVGANRGSSSPPMGDGQWPGGESASFHNVQYVDTSGQPYDPPAWPGGLKVVVSNKKCYQASIFTDNMFYYGGPGGCTD